MTHAVIHTWTQIAGRHGVTYEHFTLKITLNNAFRWH